MAHIKRRDFAWNLIYELLFLPVSFHPAALLVKRRINETRELACDETVSELLLDAQAYARSIVSLANSSFSTGQTTYILGVNNADILEESVMKLLAKQTSVNTRRAIDDYSPLANLIVEDATISWKFTPENSPTLHWQASLINEAAQIQTDGVGSAIAMVELVADRLNPDGHGETAGDEALADWIGLWAALAADCGRHALEAELGHSGLHALS
jgi:hypothetical protein